MDEKTALSKIEYFCLRLLTERNIFCKVHDDFTEKNLNFPVKLKEKVDPIGFPGKIVHLT